MKIKINRSTHMSMLYTRIVHPKIQIMSLITDALFQPRKTLRKLLRKSEVSDPPLTATTMFNAQKGSKDNVKIVHVTR